MSQVGKTLLKGHTLRREGAVMYDARGQIANWNHWAPTPLHAKCSCGALSEMGITQAEAKRWHRAHKDSLR